MTKTLDDFRHEILDDNSSRQSLDPERLAAAFWPTSACRPTPPWTS